MTSVPPLNALFAFTHFPIRNPIRANVNQCLGIVSFASAGSVDYRSMTPGGAALTLPTASSSPLPPDMFFAVFNPRNPTGSLSNRLQLFLII